MHIDEPAADLAVATALASSLRNRAVDPKTVVLGEVGLAGELRAVPQADARLAEASKLGFTRAVLPAVSTRKLRPPEGMAVIAAKRLEEALDSAIDGGDPKSGVNPRATAL
jgi:DNA repair protein RadA/Sms